MFGVQRIVSGGQTGADRAALDWAIAHQMPHGGWCPHGRIAEDGRIPETYQLQETPDADYAQRTTWNVRDSDATILLSISGELSGGSAFTESIAQKISRPFLRLSRQRHGVDEAIAQLAGFLHSVQPQVMNIAGPRASSEPDVAMFVTAVLDGVFTLASSE